MLAGVLVLLAAQPVFAKEAVEGASFTIGSKTSRMLQKYTGLTWAGEQVCNLGATVCAKVMLGGHPRTKIRFYSLSDALAGKFKSCSLSLQDCSYKKVPLANVQITSKNPMQLRMFGKPGVVSPVMLKVEGEASEKQITRALKSPAITSSLNFLKFNLPGLGPQALQVEDPQVELADGKVHINAFLVTAGGARETGIPVDIHALPVLEAKRYIVLKDTNVQSPDIVEPDKFSAFTEDLLNPLVDLGRLDRHTHAFRLSDFAIKDKQVSFTGDLLLAPKPVPTAAATTTVTK